MRIEKLRQKFDIEVKWVNFPLHPETPQEGMTLEALFAGRNYDLEASYRRMKGLMDEEGLDYARRTHTYNSRRAQELGAWADTREGGEALHEALYRAYFVDGKNIGDDETLFGIVEDAGLPVEEAREALRERRFRDAVDEDWARCRKLGVSGVPTFAAGGYGVVGAQPYETLERFLTEIGAELRAENGG